MKPPSPETNNVIKQLVISAWAAGVLLWYLHEFSPAFAPILQVLLRKLWR